MGLLGVFLFLLGWVITMIFGCSTKKYVGVAFLGLLMALTGFCLMFWPWYNAWLNWTAN